MDIKRLLTGFIGLPIIIAILVLSNTYIFDIIIAVVAFVMMDEYCRSFPKEKVKPIKWISYISCIFIAFMHIIPSDHMYLVFTSAIVVLIITLFLNVIISKLKLNIIDIAVTFFGIFYIVFLISFVSKLRGADNGRLLVWYIFLSAWGTDTMAYFIGKYFGKHKISEISPKKTVEGCIAGILGAIVFVLVYTFIINKFLGMNINYYIISGLAFLWSIMGQLGDLSESTLKRYTGIKDSSNLLPGHGGMLDRFDSVIFIAPLAYILLTMIN